jgi:mannan endo-1,4-beta-mannosidase
MKYFYLLIFTGILIGYSSLKAQTSEMLVNPNASQSAQKVLAAIYKVKEEGKLLSCQHIRERTSNLFDNRSEYQHVYDVTGKYPAIIGADFLSDPAAAVTIATQQWKRGGLVTLTWHQSSPAIIFQGDFKTVQSKMTIEDFQNIVTPGTQLYNIWLDHIDRMAQYLKTLQDSGVVVLWRPYHEMNGGWFWWGDKGEAFHKLWINMFDRYTNYHHLNNLICVFGPNIYSKDPEIFFPGSQYVDIGGLDIYNSTRKLDVAQHDHIKEIMKGKPIAMTETGILPTIDDMITKSEYVWFMPWTTGWCDNTFYGMPHANGPGNNADILKEYYSNPSVITLENLAEYLK